MDCKHRRLAWYNPRGGVKLSFDREAPAPNWIQLSVPCGKCAACQLNRSSEASLRAGLEQTYHKTGCFLTCTYDDEHLPPGFSLRKKDIQDFLKRLRMAVERAGLGKIDAYFACGEYGGKFGRPHYHLLIFGWSPSDLRYYKDSYSKLPIYTSEFVSRLWRNGYVFIGSASGKSAAYVARYTRKKQAPHQSLGDTRPAAFLLSSRRCKAKDGTCGGIGYKWFVDNWRELLKGYIVDNGKRKPIPRYFLDKLRELHPLEYAELKDCRAFHAINNPKVQGITSRGWFGSKALILGDEVTDEKRLFVYQDFTGSDLVDVKQIMRLADKILERQIFYDETVKKRLTRNLYN